MTPAAAVAPGAVPATTDTASATSAWTVWVALSSVTSIVIGVYWDISWHMSIGRDSFWTPAHLAIQFGGILAASSSAGLIFATTFGKSAARTAASIRVWGFRGPLGAFLCAWGGVAMAASAPFDNWWHEAYGLDVKILSPPHMVLNLGILGVNVGSLLLILSAMNRAGPAQRRTFARVLLLVGGEMTLLNLTAVWERTFRVLLHTGAAYVALALVAPTLVLALARASEDRWGATRLAAVYTGLSMLGMLVMPLFSAEPKLGPVYQPITHFIPLDFPLLILVPAIVIDLLRARLSARSWWQQALVLGPAFVAVIVAVQWPFADFLMSPASHNRVFGTHYLPYFIPPHFHVARGEFVTEPLNATLIALGFAVVAAIVSSGIGLVAGDAMRKVRR
jgi:hypothetical protein